ncbi:GAF and HD-GYP domain-containing protein, partial [Photobacterium phosphoreum]|uniref:GAF and HD-GYP domain-containing protein n=1 Tax=Photobacterium phosphoreum TaxID=659 RepID=UPI001E5D5D67
MILSSAREITGADAGTLYIIEPNGQNLRFAIVQNNSLNINFGEKTNDPNDPGVLIPLYNADNTPNLRTVAASAVLTASTINIADAYNEANFDFSGTYRYDKKSNYRSTSFLTVPLIDHNSEVIAALQLINKLDNNKQAIPFSATDQEIVESLASQAAVALSNQRLITELRTLFNSFTRVIGAAIDAKSPQTGAHCRRVPDATLMLAAAASGANFPGLEGFVMSDDDMYELQTAAWLHDCGKVVTPHHIVEKSTKLETVVDRIQYITQRFDILIRDIQLERVNLELNALQKGQEIPLRELSLYDAKLAQLADDRNFLERANIGSETMSDTDIQR